MVSAPWASAAFIVTIQSVAPFRALGVPVLAIGTFLQAGLLSICCGQSRDAVASSVLAPSLHTASYTPEQA